MNWSDSTRIRQRTALEARLIEVVSDRLRPPPKLTVSQWADTYRHLPAESAAEPGRWSTSRAEYQRGVMDSVSDPEITTVVLMTSAQIGKTEIINNVVGFHIHQDPAPMLVVQPTLDMAQTWSKDRLSPTLRDTPVLADKVADARSRDSGNTVLHKTFPGGHVTACGANSPASLASRPCRVILMDEVDRYPVSAGTEGDPVSLARKRASTFWNKKFIEVSTPTERGASRIEASYEASDRRKYFVPCPDCGEYQTLEWRNVKWRDGDSSTAEYMCDHCGTLWNDVKRHRAVRQGEWRATATGVHGVAGFHLNALYSPWISLREGVQDFLDAKTNPMRLRTWVNTFLGETWEEEGDTFDEHDLRERVEYWGDELPPGVALLTAGVDVQDDRLEVEIVGWGCGEESWSIDYQVLYGDPSTAELWSRLDVVLANVRRHPMFGDMIVRGTCIDSGGHYTQAVYKYGALRRGKRIFVIKGVAGEGKPISGRPSRNNIGKINLFPVGVDTAKELLYGRLRIKEAGPGYCHFPDDRSHEYFRGLASERRVTRYFKGRPRREWVKDGTKRNEPLDCRVYAMAALHILNVNVDSVYNHLLSSVVLPGTERPKSGPRVPLRSAFVQGFKI